MGLKAEPCDTIFHLNKLRINEQTNKQINNNKK